MNIRKRIVIIPILIILCTIVFHPSEAKAEGFSELFVGSALSRNRVITFSVQEKEVKAGGNFHNSFCMGYRLGYWFECYPWLGSALEVSRFQPEIDKGEITIIPLTMLVMFRMPLSESPEYLGDKIMPYIGIGPGLFFSDFEYKVAESPIPDLLNIQGFSGTYADRSSDIGLDFRAGISRPLTKNTALFLEYRYTRFNPSFKEEVSGTKVTIKSRIITHHVGIGFSYFF